MKIVSHLSMVELRQMAERLFGSMVKGVVDIDRGLIAVDAELHADLEAMMIENGSRQENLWGINFYPDEAGEQFVEFDSMINVRPSQGNRSRGVENAGIRARIVQIVRQVIHDPR